MRDDIRVLSMILLVTGFMLTGDITVKAERPASVQFRHEELDIPTYTFGRSSTGAPLFQIGNTKGVYPYAPLDRDSLSNEPEPVTYEALILENEFLRVQILPELGGRVWSVLDKTTNRQIFHYDSVIKPSAYNHRGGWPAGNIEVYGPFDSHMLTWPGEPWSWALREWEDGSATIILSHIDHFFRNKIFLETTVYPGRAYIELTIKLFNRTQLPNRYMLWTNAGIPATMGSRFIYPMSKTIGHDSSAYGSWPVYEGIDISWYKNNKAMLGVFGLDVYDDFIAAYDYEEDYGTVCFTDREIARGIKNWTWGLGQTGLRHMESYTDSGIPYVEVQSGRFVWEGNYEFINPGKSDGWTEYWYGIGGLKGLSTASRDVAAHVSRELKTIRLHLASTGEFPDAKLIWQLDGGKEWSEPLSLSVGNPLSKDIEVDPDSDTLEFRIASGGKTLLNYAYYFDERARKGEFASDAIPRSFGPSEDLTTEEVFQKGLTSEKLGQTGLAVRAYEEVLERDPDFTQANLQMGILALSQLKEDLAISHFRRVLRRDPANGDAHYYLAIASLRVAKPQEARQHFLDLLPSSGKYDQRNYGLGVIALRENNLEEAEQRLAEMSRTFPTQLSARQAYVFLLRQLSRKTEADRELRQILSLDPTNTFARAEQAFWNGWDGAPGERLDRTISFHPQGFLELATEYMHLGAWDEVKRVTHRGRSKHRESSSRPYPLLGYFEAYACYRLGLTGDAAEILQDLAGTEVEIDLFPFRWETKKVLRKALELNPTDANAATLLGDLLYAHLQQAEAIVLWRKAANNGPSFLAAHRNLGWALVEKGATEEALGFLSRAAAIRPGDLETAAALSQLYLRLNHPEKALEVVEAARREQPSNDRVLQMVAAALTNTGRYDEALEILSSHSFGPRHQSYSLLNLYRGVRLLKALDFARGSSFKKALDQMALASHTPSNLGMDDFAALKSSRLLFFEAFIHQAAGEDSKAEQVWTEASQTIDHDFNGEGLFRAIALHKLGVEATDEWFRNFEEINPARREDNDFEVKVRAHYLAGIYAIFRGRPEEGKRFLLEATELDGSDLFARQALGWLEAGLFESL